jgi:hypothetical protein
MGVCELDSDRLPQPTGTVVHPPFPLNIDNLTKASGKLGFFFKAKNEKFLIGNIEAKEKNGIRKTT